MKKSLEIMIGDDKVVLTAEPSPTFRVIKALQDAGYDPQVRYEDEELQGWTCWQPTKAA